MREFCYCNSMGVLIYGVLVLLLFVVGRCCVRACVRVVCVMDMDCLHLDWRVACTFCKPKQKVSPCSMALFAKSTEVSPSSCAFGIRLKVVSTILLWHHFVFPTVSGWC